MLGTGDLRPATEPGQQVVEPTGPVGYSDLGRRVKSAGRACVSEAGLLVGAELGRLPIPWALRCWTRGRPPYRYQATQRWTLR